MATLMANNEHGWSLIMIHIADTSCFFKQTMVIILAIMNYYGDYWKGHWWHSPEDVDY